jgi:hypothetical protein
MASKDAVRHILCCFTKEDRGWAEAASAVWFTHAGVREDIIEKLEASGLDESAIEAETMRRVAHDVERLDRMMASREMRVRRAFGDFADYREFANQARMASNRRIEVTPRLSWKSGGPRKRIEHGERAQDRGKST